MEVSAEEAVVVNRRFGLMVCMTLAELGMACDPLMDKIPATATIEDLEWKNLINARTLKSTLQAKAEAAGVQVEFDENLQADVLCTLAAEYIRCRSSGREELPCDVPWSGTKLLDFEKILANIRHKFVVHHVNGMRKVFAKYRDGRVECCHILVHHTSAELFSVWKDLAIFLSNTLACSHPTFPPLPEFDPQLTKKCEEFQFIGNLTNEPASVGLDNVVTADFIKVACGKQADTGISTWKDLLSACLNLRDLKEACEAHAKSIVLLDKIVSGLCSEGLKISQCLLLLFSSRVLFNVYRCIASGARTRKVAIPADLQNDVDCLMNFRFDAAHNHHAGAALSACVWIEGRLYPMMPLPFSRVAVEDEGRNNTFWREHVPQLLTRLISSQDEVFAALKGQFEALIPSGTLSPATYNLSVPSIFALSAIADGPAHASSADTKEEEEEEEDLSSMEMLFS